MAFYCVNDGVPEATTRLLREACLTRSIDYQEIHAPLFDYRDERQLEPGDLLYRPAVSFTAIRVEQFLYADGVSTFYADPEGVYFNPMAAAMLFQRAGLDIPLTFYCPTPDRGLLSGYVDRLGGFPVVVKMLGYSRGIGVIRVDSLPALYSVMDFATAEGKTPQLMAYVDEAVHWRLTVVGDRVASAYRNTQEIDDFRTYASDEPRGLHRARAARHGGTGRGRRPGAPLRVRRRRRAAASERPAVSARVELSLLFRDGAGSDRDRHRGDDAGSPDRESGAARGGGLIVGR